MALRITEDCIKCTACEPWCRNLAISEGDATYVIDPDRCTECVGIYPLPKCLEICPLGAARPDPAHRETRAALLAKWQVLHPGETPVEG